MVRRYIRDRRGRFARVTDAQRATIKKAMRHVYENPPPSVVHTRAKFGDAAANAQVRAVAMDLVRTHKGRIPRRKYGR